MGIWWRVNRPGVDPFLWTPDPADGRWQSGAVVRAFYLADTEDTAWAEWYRHTAELGAPPASRMPRDTWRISVDRQVPITRCVWASKPTQLRAGGKVPNLIDVGDENVHRGPAPGLGGADASWYGRFPDVCTRVTLRW